MKNAELLLIGGTNPYANATHWITVGEYTGTSAGVSQHWFGWSSSSDFPTFGALSPSSIPGTLIPVVSLYDAYSESSDWFLTVQTNPNSGNPGKIKATNLFSGLTATVEYEYDDKLAMWFPSPSGSLGLKDYLNQKVPLIIEVIS